MFSCEFLGIFNIYFHITPPVAAANYGILSFSYFDVCAFSIMEILLHRMLLFDEAG